jgi:cytochrome c biogenesis protein CcmG/thiol:disulfide interchange protein DsbE
MNRYLIPLAAFFVLLLFLGAGLTLNPREVPSTLINRPAPNFQLPQLNELHKISTPQDMLGKVWLLNVWASWCGACREEHPLLVDLSKSGIVPIFGLNYKDQRPEALDWLKRFGDPYTLSIVDAQGLVGIDYGVYGVPETFVIDKTGVIRYKHIGPITRESWDAKLLPLIKALEQ